MPSEIPDRTQEKAPLPQLRARHAMRRIEEIKGKSPGNYLGYVKSLPATILKNGLGQAIAMELMGSQKDDGHERLYADCEQWLCFGWPQRTAGEQKMADGTLMKAIVAADQDTYVRLQIEALEYLAWLKKFAVAFLDKKKTGESSSPQAGRATGGAA